jgi:hypothetical protein
MISLNQVAVCVFFVLCVEVTGVILFSLSSGFDAQPLAACYPGSGLFIVKTVAGRKALIAKAFGIVVYSDLTWRL